MSRFWTSAIAVNAFVAQGTEIVPVIARTCVIQLQASAWCNKFVDRCLGALEILEAPALAGDQA